MKKYMRISNQDVGVHGFQSVFRARMKRHELATEQLKVVHALNDDLNHVEWMQRALTDQLNGREFEREVQHRTFVRACPFADCKGFLSTAWKCGLCENWTCPTCHEVKGKEKDTPHTCDPGNVATAELLAKDSRNCPKCAALIFKINGCDQMYCTQCHTAFSWRTGRVETGTIHNPHYYEFRRAHGGMPRAAGDVPCGGFPDFYTVRGTLAQHTSQNSSMYKFVMNAHRMWGHMEWEIHRYQTPNVVDENRDLRIKLMIGDVSEAVFKSKIQQREKARQRKTDIRQVIDMLRAVLLDLFQEYAASKDHDVLVPSLYELKSHYNETLDRVSKNYGKCAVPRLSENFDMH
jgi:hypothetical protein